MQLTKRMIDWLGLAACLALGTAIGYPLLHGQTLALRALSADQAQLAQRMAASTEVMDTVRSGEERLAQLKEKNSAVESKLAPTLEFQSFYTKLAAAAEQRGLVLREVQPGAISADIYYVMMPVNITAEGPFPAFNAFLEDVLDAGQLIKVTHMDIHAAQDPEKCAMAFALVLYGAAGQAPA